MQTILAIGIGILAILLFAIAVLIISLVAEAGAVWLSIARAGPQAADEALRRGDSEVGYWDPSKAKVRRAPHHAYRKGRAGRWIPGRGIAAVQEHAPLSSAMN